MRALVTVPQWRFRAAGPSRGGAESAVKAALMRRFTHHNCPQTHTNTGATPVSGASRKVC